MKDLLVVAADKSMQQALKGLLARPQALGIREVEVDIYPHPRHDPGCALRGVEFMSDWSDQYHHGLLMFDHEGSGREQTHPQELQKALNEDFANSAWGERAKTVILCPELEVWVWSDSPHVSRVAGWGNGNRQLRSWLIEQNISKKVNQSPHVPRKLFRQRCTSPERPAVHPCSCNLRRTYHLSAALILPFLNSREYCKSGFLYLDEA